MVFQRFDKELEHKFKDDIYRTDLYKLRVTLVLCVIFYAAYFFTDTLLLRRGIITDLQWEKFFRIRFYYAIPVFIVNFLLTYQKDFRKYQQPVTTISYIIAGMGVALMLVEVPHNFSYYGGMFLIFAVGHFLTRLYLEFATLGSLVIIAFYNIVVINDGGSWEDVFMFTAFYLGFVIIGVYASYNSERYRRQNFLQTHRLKGDKVILERNLYENLLDMENSHRMTIFSLARLAESRDQYTGNHIERVGGLCLQLSELIPEEYYVKCGEYKQSFIEIIELASTLHDIGKVAIPEHILMKPGKLSDDEMNVMKTHTVIGSDTLSEIKESYNKNAFVNMGIDICLYHHERWDGSGYPKGLKGQQIPLSSRIVAIVDVYDALISERPYKQAFTHEKAIEIMDDEKQHFDPYLYSLFVNMMKK